MEVELFYTGHQVLQDTQGPRCKNCELSDVLLFFLEYLFVFQTANLYTGFLREKIPKTQPFFHSICNIFFISEVHTISLTEVGYVFDTFLPCYFL